MKRNFINLIIVLAIAIACVSNTFAFNTRFNTTDDQNRRGEQREQRDRNNNRENDQGRNNNNQRDRGNEERQPRQQDQNHGDRKPPYVIIKKDKN